MGKDLNNIELPLFYQRALEYGFEFKNAHVDHKPFAKEVIIWNNRDIKSNIIIIMIISPFCAMGRIRPVQSLSSGSGLVPPFEFHSRSGAWTWVLSPLTWAKLFLASPLSFPLWCPEQTFFSNIIKTKKKKKVTIKWYFVALGLIKEFWL